MQPIYVEGYVMSQNEIDGFQKPALEAGEKRVDAIGKGLPG